MIFLEQMVMILVVFSVIYLKVTIAIAPTNNNIKKIYKNKKTPQLGAFFVLIEFEIFLTLIYKTLLNSTINSNIRQIESIK